MLSNTRPGKATRPTRATAVPAYARLVAAKKRRADVARKDRLVKVTAEAIVEVNDASALEKAVLNEVDSTEFSVGPGQSLADVRAEVRRDVRGDPAGAVSWVVDVDAVIRDMPGLRVVSSNHAAVEVDGSGHELATGPDFTELFSVCRCGGEDCDSCTGFQLTPRTAAVLWTVGQILADHAYDDVNEHGDAPVVDEDDWNVFVNYPRVTWRQNAVWRRQAARCYDDLTDDLDAGEWPHVTCPGEEMAVHLILQAAPDAVTDDWASLADTLSRLPEHPDDYDWDMASETFLQDYDILSMFDEQLDGIEDPEAESNQLTGMGDYRPEAWFRPFANREPRDGRRPFRR